MMTVFICLTGENWNAIMLLFANKFGHGYCLYFISIIIVGHMMLLNIFLAILLKYIEEESDATENNKMKEADYIAIEGVNSIFNIGGDNAIGKEELKETIKDVNIEGVY
jgi:hypothetical protein